MEAVVSEEPQGEAWPQGPWGALGAARWLWEGSARVVLQLFV